MDKLNKELLEEAKKYDYSWKLVKALIALLPDSRYIPPKTRKQSQPSNFLGILKLVKMVTENSN